MEQHDLHEPLESWKPKFPGDPPRVMGIGRTLPPAAGGPSNGAASLHVRPGTNTPCAMN